MRARLGDKKAPPRVASALLAGIVLMVIGFRMSDFIPVWEPPYALRYVNNLLVLVAIFLMSPAPAKGVLLNKMRHPQLTGFALWAGAHLLVNSDLHSIVLFGGLLTWALTEMIVINRAEPDWAGREKGSVAKDAIFAIASVALFGAIGVIHGLVGPSVF